LITVLTDPTDQHLHLFGHITPWEPDLGHGHVLEAGRIATAIADEMNVVVAMLAPRTIVPA
jgi:hypothetical protein